MWLRAVFWLKALSHRSRPGAALLGGHRFREPKELNRIGIKTFPAKYYAKKCTSSVLSILLVVITAFPLARVQAIPGGASPGRTGLSRHKPRAQYAYSRSITNFRGLWQYVFNISSRAPGCVTGESRVGEGGSPGGRGPREGAGSEADRVRAGRETPEPFMRIYAGLTIRGRGRYLAIRLKTFHVRATAGFRLSAFLRSRPIARNISP